MKKVFLLLGFVLMAGFTWAGELTEPVLPKESTPVNHLHYKQLQKLLAPVAPLVMGR